MRARATRGPVSLCPRVSERVSDAHTVLEYTFFVCSFDIFPRARAPTARERLRAVCLWSLSVSLSRSAVYRYKAVSSSSW